MTRTWSILIGLYGTRWLIWKPSRDISRQTTSRNHSSWYSCLSGTILFLSCQNMVLCQSNFQFVFLDPRPLLIKKITYKSKLLCSRTKNVFLLTLFGKETENGLLRVRLILIAFWPRPNIYQMSYHYNCSKMERLLFGIFTNWQWHSDSLVFCSIHAY